jgi:hypothetical protein
MTSTNADSTWTPSPAVQWLEDQYLSREYNTNDRGVVTQPMIQLLDDHTGRDETFEDDEDAWKGWCGICEDCCVDLTPYPDPDNTDPRDRWVWL